MSKKVFSQIEKLATEASNPASSKLDQMTTRQVLRLINSEDHKIAPAVKKTIPQIEKAVDLVASAFQTGGRLFYVGAGTSGRLGVLDASECPPTFGVQPSMVQGIIAGGRRTLVLSREGIEDDIAAAEEDITKKNIGELDVVIGIATSNRTPYTLAALRRAKKLCAKTVFLCCNRPVKLPFKPDVIINPVTGPEVVAGSTRMKAGTATKLVLNMITTAAMVKIGKTYGNLMVDLQATSEKLTQRSIRILMLTCKLDYQRAKKLLNRAGGWVKAGILMHLLDIDLKTAKNLLKQSSGRLSNVLSDCDL